KLFSRTVSEVSRRELTLGGRRLYGPPPAELLPPVTDEQLADFIRTELRTFWYPATDHRLDWLRDIWVDLGLVTVARATVTLREGRLITKGEALDLLAAEPGAPQSVVHDIRRRRYGHSGGGPHRFDPRWRVERARLARTFVRHGIERALET
ncbi:MAG TPA: nucleotidyltransferase, partial [Streptomyces sp.]